MSCLHGLPHSVLDAIVPATATVALLLALAVLAFLAGMFWGDR